MPTIRPTHWLSRASRALAAELWRAPPDAPVVVESWAPKQVGALAIVFAVCLALGWMVRLPELGTGEDEAVYLLLSESMASGHYRDEAVLGAPLHAKYPPGTSSWILLVHAVAGSGLDAVRIGNLLLLVLSGLFVADGWRRLGHPWIGIGAAAIALWNPFLLQVSTTLSSEPLFLALSTGALWAALRAATGNPPRWLSPAAWCAMPSEPWAGGRNGW